MLVLHIQEHLSATESIGVGTRPLLVCCLSFSKRPMERIEPSALPSVKFDKRIKLNVETRTLEVQPLSHGQSSVTIVFVQSNTLHCIGNVSTQFLNIRIY